MAQILMMKRVISLRFGRSKKFNHRVTDVSFPMEVNGEKSFWAQWHHVTEFGHYVNFASTVVAVPGGLGAELLVQETVVVRKEGLIDTVCFQVHPKVSSVSQRLVRLPAVRVCRPAGGLR